MVRSGEEEEMAGEGMKKMFGKGGEKECWSPLLIDGFSSIYSFLKTQFLLGSIK